MDMSKEENLTVGNAWGIFNSKLSEYYSANEIHSLGNIIFEHFFNLDPAQRILQRNHLIAQGFGAKLEEIIEQLKLHIPVQYITGVAHFCNLQFEVDKRVLIPRPETEELVAWVYSTICTNCFDSSQLQILDVCTGSGCIAISLAKQLKDAKIKGCDISEAALDLAMENAKKNQTEVEFFHFDALNDSLLLQNLDAIVCNPPYVTNNEKMQMQTNVLNFEPHLALFVPDNDPLLFYRAVARLAYLSLKSGGWLFFEINENFSNETSLCIINEGFKDVQLKRDFNQKPRFIAAQKIL